MVTDFVEGILRFAVSRLAVSECAVCTFTKVPDPLVISDPKQSITHMGDGLSETGHRTMGINSKLLKQSSPIQQTLTWSVTVAVTLVIPIAATLPATLE